VTSGKVQILNLLLSICEEVLRSNEELQASQAELRLAKTELQKRVEQRTSELSHANDHLQQETAARLEAEARVQRLAALVASSEDGIIGTDRNAVITDWNAGAEHLFGYKASEATGQSILTLVPADGWSQGRDTIERLRRGEEVHPYEAVRMRKD